MKVYVRIGRDNLFEWGDGDFIDAKVHLTTGKKSKTTELTLADPRLELANTLPAPYRGNRTSMDVFLGEGLNPTRLFSGYVSRLQPTGLPGRLVILGVGASSRAKRKERSRNLANTSPEQFAKRMAKELEVKLDLSEANLKDLGRKGSFMQHAETDWDVLHRMCEAVGHSVEMTTDALVIRDEGTEPDGRNSVILRLGENVRDGWSFDLDERTRKTTARITEYNKGRIYESFDDDSLPQQRDVTLNRQGMAFLNEDVPSFTESSLNYAKRAQKRGREVFTARMDCTELLIQARPKTIAGVQGFGQRLSGAYWIKQVTHNLGQDQFTSLELYNEGAP